MDLFERKLLNALDNLETNGEVKRVPQSDGDDKWCLTGGGDEATEKIDT